MITPQYFENPHGDPVACIGKVGSSAIAKALVLKYWPERKPTTAGYPMENTPLWHIGAKKLKSPERAIIPVRDPVNRFYSACTQSRLDPALVLQLIGEGGEGSPLHRFHFAPVSLWHIPGCKVVRFPDGVDELVKLMGLESLPQTNDSERMHEWRPSPLTKSQIRKLGDIYADDINLFNSSKT